MFPTRCGHYPGLGNFSGQIEMESWRESLKPATEFIDAATSGMPISSDMENMDFLQFSSDSEFVPLCGLPTVGFRPSKAA
jgi:hypothetical protein